MEFNCTVYDKVLDEILERQKKLSSIRFENGYFEDKVHSSSGEVMGSIAATLEDGNDRMPSRPFILKAALLFDPKSSTSVFKDYVLNKKDLNGCLTRLGDDCSDNIKKSIESQEFAPLSRVTIELKGNNKILVDTGELMESSESRW